jgi:hypothetical protein
MSSHRLNREPRVGVAGHVAPLGMTLQLVSEPVQPLPALLSR